MPYANASELEAALRNDLLSAREFELKTYAETPAGLAEARRDLLIAEELLLKLGTGLTTDRELAKRDKLLGELRRKVSALEEKLGVAPGRALYSEPWDFTIDGVAQSFALMRKATEEANAKMVESILGKCPTIPAREFTYHSIKKVDRPDPGFVPLNAVFGKPGARVLAEREAEATRLRLESELSAARLRHKELVDNVNRLLAEHASDDALRDAMERAFEAGMAEKMCEQALAKVPPSTPAQWNRAIEKRLEQYKSAGFVGPLFDAPRGGTMDRSTLESGQDGFFFELGSAAVVSMPVKNVVGRSISLHTPGLRKARIVGPIRGGVLYVLATGQIRPFTVPALREREAFSFPQMPPGAEAIVYSGQAGFDAREAAEVFAGMAGEEYRFRIRGDFPSQPSAAQSPCAHPSFAMGSDGRFYCSGQGCSLSLPRGSLDSLIRVETEMLEEAFKKQKQLTELNREAAEDLRQRNCQLSDQLGELECENNELLRDNAKLRRDFEKATRKAGK